MEDTSERKNEETNPLNRKGRKPNKFHRELQTAREKVAGKQSSLDHLVRSYPLEKQDGETVEGKKDRVLPQTYKK